MGQKVKSKNETIRFCNASTLVNPLSPKDVGLYNSKNERVSFEKMALADTWTHKHQVQGKNIEYFCISMIDLETKQKFTLSIGNADDLMIVAKKGENAGKVFVSSDILKMLFVGNFCIDNEQTFSIDCAAKCDEQKRAVFSVIKSKDASGKEIETTYYRPDYYIISDSHNGSKPERQEFFKMYKTWSETLPKVTTKKKKVLGETVIELNETEASVFYDYVKAAWIKLSERCKAMNTPAPETSSEDVAEFEEE